MNKNQFVPLEVRQREVKAMLADHDARLAARRRAAGVRFAPEWKVRRAMRRLRSARRQAYLRRLELDCAQAALQRCCGSRLEQLRRIELDLAQAALQAGMRGAP